MPAELPSASLSGSTSHRLIDRARQRDPAAWRRLVELYGPLVYHWCRTSRVPPDDAADVVQEVFRGVATGLPGLDLAREGASFRGWLRVVARNKIADYARREASRPRAAGGTTAQEAIRELPADEADDDSHPEMARERQIHAALAVLQGEVQERTWQAFWRTTVDGRAAADVAAELGMQPGSVYQAKSRLLARLRELLAAATGE
jgi:RNA polymerase sigma-70 factor (ECF subfamily)